MKRLVSYSLLTLACIGCLFVSCTSPPNSTENVLHLNLGQDPHSIDPRQAQLVQDLTLTRQLYEGLLRIDNTGPKMALAENVTRSDDQLTYTFTLREAYWSNGEPITAHDFVRSWQEVLSPQFLSSYAYMLYPIKNAQLAKLGKCTLEAIGIVALDDRTLVVHLEQPTPYFLELTAFPTFFPVNVNTPYLALPVSSGPFVLESWNTNDHVLIKKNPRYWDSEHVYLDAIDFSLVQDAHTENYLFEQGKLDWLGQPISNNIPLELLKTWKDQGKVCSYDIDGTFWLKINTTVPPFHNKSLRHALAVALNRELLIQHLLGGAQKPATSPLPPPLSLHPTPFFPDGNQELARKYLAEACKEEGWTLETIPPITLEYPSSERTNKIVQLVQSQWKETLGISVQLQAVEKALYRSKTRLGDYQIGTGEWIADYHDPISFLELFKNINEEGVGMNDTGWHNANYTDLLTTTLTETDPETRRALLQKAETLLMEDMPIIPLYHYAFEYVKKDEVSGVVPSPLGTTDFKSAFLQKKTS